MLRFKSGWFVIFSAVVVMTDAAVPALGFAREWTDSTGKYKVNADLIAQSETTVVLKKEDRQLLEVPLEKLSAQDQQYLKSPEVAEQIHHMSSETQTWSMQDGWKIVGKVVDYARRDVVLQRRHDKIYVNDRPFDDLPKPYQAMLPFMVSHFEQIQVKNKADLEAWILKFKGEPRKFTCEGVLMDLADGEEFCVPFFLFNDADCNILKPGWERWAAAADEKDRQQHQAFLLKSQAKAYQRDRRAVKQIAQMHLELQAYKAGLFDLWEVAMTPGAGVNGRSMVVVVPARNSSAAAAAAAQKYPGYVPGAISRVVR